MTPDSVADEEIVWRRIPAEPPFYQPPDHVASINFKLRPRETGLSVYRAALTTADAVLNVPGAIPGSFLVEATAGEIRRLCGPSGKTLSYDVRPDDPDGTNPGHAVIVAPEGRITEGGSKSLRRLFRRVTQDD